MTPPNSALSRDPRSTATLDEILTTDRLRERPSRQPDHASENEALMLLTRQMTESPETLLQTLVDTACRLCQAGSAGISLQEEGEPEAVFRWRVTTGELGPFKGGTMPRSFSPCGAVLDCERMLVMDEPIRHYPYIEKLGIPIRQVLLAPFPRSGRLVGTVWVVNHGSRQFDAEDARLIDNLARFASAAVTLLEDKQQSQALAKELEQRVIERTTTLAERLEELETFSYSMSHDLRAPLRAMQGFAHILSEEFDQLTEAKIRDYCGRIAAGAERLDRLVQDVLTLSRIGRKEMPLEQIDLNEFFQQFRVEMPLFEGGKGECWVSPELPRVMANGAALTQSFGNLLSNCLKFASPERALKVRVWSERDSKRARIFVEDNGIGISEEEHEKIFGVFYQIKPDQRGTGIGLAIARKVVERMQGRLTVKSHVGTGTTFCLELLAGD